MQIFINYQREVDAESNDESEEGSTTPDIESPEGSDHAELIESGEDFILAPSLRSIQNKCPTPFFHY